MYFVFLKISMETAQFIYIIIYIYYLYIIAQNIPCLENLLTQSLTWVAKHLPYAPRNYIWVAVSPLTMETGKSTFSSPIYIPSFPPWLQVSSKMLLVGLCSWGKGQNATVMGILRNYKKIYSEDDFIRMQNRGRSKERKTCNLPESLVTVFANCMRKL